MSISEDIDSVRAALKRQAFARITGVAPGDQRELALMRDWLHSQELSPQAVEWVMEAPALSWVGTGR